MARPLRGFHTFLLLLGFSLSCCLPANGSAPESVSGKSLRLAGSSTMAPLLAEIARLYMRRHPDVHIAVHMGGSGHGLQALRAGQADIAMVSRALNEDEQALYWLPIARDGIAVVVHRANQVPDLSARQLAAIYGGKIGNWREVGGADAPIHVLGAGVEAGSSELFAAYLGLPYRHMRLERVLHSNGERLAAVAADPLAIVYSSAGEAEREGTAGRPVRALAADGIAASASAIRKGGYPISRPLSLVARSRPEGMLRDFFQFCISSEVTAAIQAHDFVPYLD